MSVLRPLLGRFLLLALLPLVACSSEQGGQGGFPALPVETVKVQAGPLVRSFHAVGSLESPASAQIATEVAGKVDFLDVPEGQKVEAGHVLARLDQGEAKAALTVANARFENARERLARLERLRNQQVIAQQSLDDARAELRMAEGEREQARTRFEKTEIRAPFSGVVGLRKVNLGQYLRPGDPVVQITQIDPLHLVFALPEREAAEAREGQRVRFGVAACGEPLEGSVIAVSPYVDPATRTAEVKALVSNTDGALRPGMSADADLEVGRVENGLVIPQEAIIRGTQALSVMVVGADNTVQPTTVKAGLWSEKEVEIVEGLSDGDVVVTSGFQKVGPGAKVTPIERAPIENPLHQLGTPLSAPCIP